MVKIRLRRMGSRNRPFYRIVVSDSRRAPTSIALEEIGYYDPLRDAKDGIKINMESYNRWIKNGAHVSNTVKRLVKKFMKLNDSGKDHS